MRNVVEDRVRDHRNHRRCCRFFATAATVVFIVVAAVTGVGDEYESFVAVTVFVVAVCYFDLAATGPVVVVVVVADTGSFISVEA